MAGLLFMEGFETFGVNGDTGTALHDVMEQKWTDIYIHTAAKLSSNAYENEGLCLDFVSSTATWRITQSHHTSTNEVIVGWAWYTGTLANGYQYAAENLTYQLRLYGYSTGGFQVQHGAGSHNTPTGLFVANTWYYIELKYKIADSPDGYWKLYVDGVLVDSETGIDTWNNTYPAEISTHYWTPGGRLNTRLDDLYIYDNTGDIQEPYGPVKIRALVPDGDDTVNWSSTGGNHYDQVNDIPVDTANYVESNTPNDVDLFSFANSTDPTSWPIYGVQLNVYAAVTDVGSFTLEGIADSGSSQTIVNEAIVDNLGGQYSFVFENDPDTASAWTIDQLNAANFGVGVE